MPGAGSHPQYLYCTLLVHVMAVQVYFYSMTGVRVSKQVSFGPQLESEGISQACIYPDGLVVLGASSNQLWAVVGLQEPRAVRLPAIPGLTGNSSSSAAVSCLAVLEPQFTLSNGLEVGGWCWGWCRGLGLELGLRLGQLAEQAIHSSC